MSILISVIVPVYNASKYIKDTLHSIINQTYRDIEILCIDDGSTDNSAYIIKKMSQIDDRIIYIYQENKGVSSARNRGLIEARGKYISFLDSDDLYCEKFITEMYNALSATKSKFCYCGYMILKNNKLTTKYSKFNTNNLLRDYLLGKTKIHTSSWLIEKEFLIKEGTSFEEKLSWGEDILFFSEVIKKGLNNYTFVPKYLTIYRNDSDPNKLSNFSMNKMDVDVEVADKIINKISLVDDTEECNAINGYRLPALLTYRLSLASKENVDKELYCEYYKKYQNKFFKNSFNNGLRSIKLLINQIKIFLIYKTII